MDNPIGDKKESKYAWISLIVILVLIMVLVFINPGGKSIQKALPSLAPTQTEILIRTPTVNPNSLNMEKPQLSITIDKMIEYTDRYYIQAHISKTNNTPIEINSIDFSKIKLIDSKGNELKLTPIYIRHEFTPGDYYFSFSTDRKGFPGKMTLTVPSVVFTVNYPGFFFDIDLFQLKKGFQDRSINQEFYFFNRLIKLSSVQLLTDEGKDPIIRFVINGDDSLLKIGIADTNDNTLSYHYVKKNEPLISEYFYSGNDANHYFEKINHFQINYFSYIENIDLNATWLPENVTSPGAINTSEFASACKIPNSIVEMENKALSNFPVRPLGKLILKGQNDSAGEEFYAELHFPFDNFPRKLFSLNGKLQSVISNDTKYIATIDYERGMVIIYNLLDGSKKILYLQSYKPNIIAFSDDNKFLYIIPYGGLIFSYEISTQIIRNVINQQNNYWIDKVIPFQNEKILFQTVTPKTVGGDLYSEDLITGNIQLVKEGFVDIIGFSDEKERILFSDNIIDTYSTGYFISNLDGSDRQLLLYLIDDEYYSNRSGAISPDEKWVIISQDYSPFTLLIDLSTCDYYSIDIGNYFVIDWVE